MFVVWKSMSDRMQAAVITLTFVFLCFLVVATHNAIDHLQSVDSDLSDTKAEVTELSSKVVDQESEISDQKDSLEQLKDTVDELEAR